MIDLKKKKVIVLSPHPEDGEIGCGGLVQRLKKDNSKSHLKNIHDKIYFLGETKFEILSRRFR